MVTTQFGIMHMQGVQYCQHCSHCHQPARPHHHHLQHVQALQPAQSHLLRLVLDRHLSPHCWYHRNNWYSWCGRWWSISQNLRKSESTCHPVQHALTAYRSPYDRYNCGSSHVLNAIFWESLGLVSASGDGNAECGSHNGPGSGNHIFLHHHWQEAHWEERGSTQDIEVKIEVGDALGGAMWTRRGCGLRSEMHTWRTQVRCTREEGAFGGYNCVKHTRRIRMRSGLDRHGDYGWRREHCLIKLGRYSWSGGYG